MLSLGFSQKIDLSVSLCEGCHSLTDVSLIGRRKLKTSDSPPKPCFSNTETPELFVVPCVWKNRSSPLTRPAFQTGKNSFHPEPQTTPIHIPPHKAHKGRAKGPAQPRIHAHLGLVEAEEGEGEKVGKLGVTEPARVEQERNGGT